MRQKDILEKDTVETIDDQPAASSPYLGILGVVFEAVPDYRKVSLYRSRGDI